MKLVQVTLNESTFSEAELHCMRSVLRFYPESDHVLLGKRECENILIGLRIKYNFEDYHLTSEIKRLLLLQLSFLACEQEIFCISSNVELNEPIIIKDKLPYLSGKLDIMFNNCDKNFFERAIFALRKGTLDKYLKTTKYHLIEHAKYNLF